MRFRTKRVLLSVPFYMVFQFFLLKYLFLLFGGISKVVLVIITILIGLNRFIPMFFEAKKSRPITRFLTALDGIWMWASLIFLIDIVFIYAVGIFINWPFEIKAILISLVPILGVYNYYKANKLVINEKTLVLDNLANDINIVHLSDVHFGAVRHKELINLIADKLKELENSCKLAIISGDLADGSSVIEKTDFEAFKKVNMPIIFTPGNHDFYMGIDNVIKACKDAGVIVLDNERLEIEGLNIFGLRFSFEDKSVPQIDENVLNPNLVNVLNYHVPYHWEKFSELGFDIQLSGHTHGGQFYPVIYVAHLIFKYNMGLFKNSLGKYLHVTTGVGSTDAPMRWGTDSELVVLKLRKS